MMILKRWLRITPCPDIIREVLAPGEKWTASSRGICLLKKNFATLTISPGCAGNSTWNNNSDGAGTLTCKHYHSSGTSYSQFAIVMDGEDACSVVRIK